MRMFDTDNIAVGLCRVNCTNLASQIATYLQYVIKMSYSARGHAQTDPPQQQ
jgi:hypothetical protein